MTRFFDLIPFDGVWVDLNEVSSACAFSCGNVLFNSSSPLPSSMSSSQTSLRDPRKLNFPPYKINKYAPCFPLILLVLMVVL